MHGKSTYTRTWKQPARVSNCRITSPIKQITGSKYTRKGTEKAKDIWDNALKQRFGTTEVSSDSSPITHSPQRCIKRPTSLSCIYDNSDEELLSACLKKIGNHSSPKNGWRRVFQTGDRNIINRYIRPVSYSNGTETQVQRRPYYAEMSSYESDSKESRSLRKSFSYHELDFDSSSSMSDSCSSSEISFGTSTASLSTTKSTHGTFTNDTYSVSRCDETVVSAGSGDNSDTVSTTTMTDLTARSDSSDSESTFSLKETKKKGNKTRQTPILLHKEKSGGRHQNPLSRSRCSSDRQHGTKNRKNNRVPDNSSLSNLFASTLYDDQSVLSKSRASYSTHSYSRKSSGTFSSSTTAMTMSTTATSSPHSVSTVVTARSIDSSSDSDIPPYTKAPNELSISKSLIVSAERYPDIPKFVSTNSLLSSNSIDDENPEYFDDATTAVNTDCNTDFGFSSTVGFDRNYIGIGRSIMSNRNSDNGKENHSSEVARLLKKYGDSDDENTKVPPALTYGKLTDEDYDTYTTSRREPSASVGTDNASYDDIDLTFLKRRAQKLEENLE